MVCGAALALTLGLGTVIFASESPAFLGAPVCITESCAPKTMMPAALDAVCDQAEAVTAQIEQAEQAAKAQQAKQAAQAKQQAQTVQVAQPRPAVSTTDTTQASNVGNCYYTDKNNDGICDYCDRVCDGTHAGRANCPYAPAYRYNNGRAYNNTQNHHPEGCYGRGHHSGGGHHGHHR